MCHWNDRKKSSKSLMFVPFYQHLIASGFKHLPAPQNQESVDLFTFLLDLLVHLEISWCVGDATKHHVWRFVSLTILDHGLRRLGPPRPWGGTSLWAWCQRMRNDHQDTLAMLPASPWCCDLLYLFLPALRRWSVRDSFCAACKTSVLPGHQRGCRERIIS